MDPNPLAPTPSIDTVPFFSPELGSSTDPTLPDPTTPLAPSTDPASFATPTPLFTPGASSAFISSPLPSVDSSSPLSSLSLTPSVSSVVSSLVISTAASLSSTLLPVLSSSSAISSSDSASLPSSTPSAGASFNRLTPNPTAPSNPDDAEWIAGYLTIHFLSDPGWWYTYIFWFVIAGVVLVFSVLHALHMRGGYLGAWWSKWSLRRRTWRKKHTLALAAKKGQKHRQPQALPSNAQIASLTSLVILTLAVAYIGPDYIAPGYHMWNAHHAPTAVYGRDESSHSLEDYVPQYTIPKAWWTTAARTGQIAYALFPLVILLALKARPFALFALPFTLNLHFDKLAWIHHWCGVLVWSITTLHVISWSAQLFKDHRYETGKIAYTYAFKFPNFVYAWAAYSLLTLLILCSMEVVRKHYYEVFYLMHVLLVPPMLILAAVHHPAVWWWCWIALGLWLADRLYRFTRFLYNNGIFRNIRTAKAAKKQHRQRPMSLMGLPDNLRLHTLNLGAGTVNSRQSRHISYPSASFVNKLALYAEEYMPPPGFFHADLLTGKTIRLRIVPPGHLTWAPGQHFLLNIPAISSCTSHPFTVASVCDESVTSGDSRELVFLVRAKGGFTRKLWDTVAAMVSRGSRHPPKERLPPGCELPPRGVLFRGYIDGPFGSAARARWGDYSTVLLVTGGSGISFGLSVLEYVCLCLSGRDGRQLGGQRGGYGKPGYKTTRVRFVWLAREFGHLQWGAAALRRCMAICPAPELQVDIFVTNMKPQLNPTPAPQPKLEDIAQAEEDELEELAPPDPDFSRGNRFDRSDKRDSRSSSVASIRSVDSDGFREDIVDTTYYRGDYVDAERSQLGHEEHVLDLTNFDGDDDTAIPGESQLNVTVKKEGKRRRTYKRKLTAARATKKERRSSGVYQFTPSPSTTSFRVENQESVTPPSSAPPSVPTFTPTRHQAKSSADLGKKYSDIYRHASSPSSDNLLGSRHTSYTSTYTPELEDYIRSNTLQKYGDVEHGGSTTPPTSATGFLAQEKSRYPPGSHPPTPPFHSKEGSGASQPPHHSRDDSSVSGMTLFSDSSSLAALVSDAAENVHLDLDDGELADISVAAECARPGRPKFDMLLADEIQMSRGALIVGCCGPTGLNAMVRKTVAAQIDPGRIRRGDMRGSIALIAEDFEY